LLETGGKLLWYPWRQGWKSLRNVVVDKYDDDTMTKIGRRKVWQYMLKEENR
jgi:hypothetical protein